MKVGMILECTQMGADGKVYSYLANQLRSDIEIEPFFLDKKPKLVEKCGEVAKRLLEIDGCEKVIIIWDFRPFGEIPNPPSCPVEDCDRVLQVLKTKLTDLQMQRIGLICIQNELETLLLFDKTALCLYLSKITGRRCNRVQIPQHPERQPDPKAVLAKIFQAHSAQVKGAKKIYRDQVDAEKIIRLVNIDKLRKCPAFQRFERRIKAL